MNGYSGTPLFEKLGLKPGYRLLLVNAPGYYRDLLDPLPGNVVVATSDNDPPYDFIHLFSADKKTLHNKFPILKSSLKKNGMFWVSWIKKASSLETDISETDVRKLGLELGLVDVKICAVDEDWSALKFMYRKKDR